MLKYECWNPGEGPFEKFKDFVIDNENLFEPSLAIRVNLEEYVHKMYYNGRKQFYLNDKDEIIACSVGYLNPAPSSSFGTYLLVLPEYESNGLGLDFVLNSLKYAKEIGSMAFKLKIRASNSMLIKCYKKLGFTITAENYFPNTDVLEYEMTKIFKH